MTEALTTNTKTDAGSTDVTPFFFFSFFRLMRYRYHNGLLTSLFGSEH